MAIDHYENFPVASLLLPAPLRAPVSVIYRFARTADDFADEGQASTDERLASLSGYGRQLERLARGQAPSPEPAGALFAELQTVIAQFGLDIQLFHDLLSAFSQDVVQARYASFVDVLDYCRRSANPVGRLMLGLYRAGTPENLLRADKICTALQLINFWQDVAVDLAKNRIYLPAEDLKRFAINGEALHQAAGTPAFVELLRFEVERARSIMHEGAPLALDLPGRIGMELRLVVQGGLRIAQKIEAVGFDVFARRPVLKRLDWPLLAWRAWRMAP
jgi:squalene synthase HpnC